MVAGAAFPGMNLVSQRLLRKHHPKRVSSGTGDMTYAGRRSEQWPGIDQGRLETADGTMIHIEHSWLLILSCSRKETPT